jgi:ribonucrease Y
MERENKERRAELSKNERRLVQKEENVDKKMDAYEKKEEKLLEQSNRLREAQAKVDALYDQQTVELERISGLTSEEAKKELLDNVREEVNHDKARLIKENGTGSQGHGGPEGTGNHFPSHPALCGRPGGRNHSDGGTPAQR